MQRERKAYKFQNKFFETQNRDTHLRKNNFLQPRIPATNNRFERIHEKSEGVVFPTLSLGPQYLELEGEQEERERSNRNRD